MEQRLELPQNLLAGPSNTNSAINEDLKKANDFTMASTSDYIPLYF